MLARRATARVERVDYPPEEDRLGESGDREQRVGDREKHAQTTLGPELIQDAEVEAEQLHESGADVTRRELDTRPLHQRSRWLRHLPWVVLAEAEGGEEGGSPGALHRAVA